MKRKVITPVMRRAALEGRGLMAGEPAAIDASEKLGQIELVNSTRMPIDLRPGRADYEALGFTFGEPIDDVFQAATMPAGWKREASDHDMWSYIIDEDGRRRVEVFYKAAFYDRNAFARLTRDGR